RARPVGIRLAAPRFDERAEAQPPGEIGGGHGQDLRRPANRVSAGAAMPAARPISARIGSTVPTTPAPNDGVATVEGPAEEVSAAGVVDPEIVGAGVDVEPVVGAGAVPPSAPPGPGWIGVDEGPPAPPGCACGGLDEDGGGAGVEL